MKAVIPRFTPRFKLVNYAASRSQFMADYLLDCSNEIAGEMQAHKTTLTPAETLARECFVDAYRAAWKKLQPQCIAELYKQ